MIRCRTASARHTYGNAPIGIIGADIHKKNPPA
jgi:hypothetical protein